MDIDVLAREAVDFGFAIHRDLGPGLFESVYEMVLARALHKRGIRVERQRPISFENDAMKFEDAFRADVLAEGKLLIEVKSVEKSSPVHGKQTLTYLRLMNLPVGLVMNFGMATFRHGKESPTTTWTRPSNGNGHRSLSVFASWRETLGLSAAAPHTLTQQCQKP